MGPLWRAVANLEKETVSPATRFAKPAVPVWNARLLMGKVPPAHKTGFPGLGKIGRANARRQRDSGGRDTVDRIVAIALHLVARFIAIPLLSGVAASATGEVLYEQKLAPYPVPIFCPRPLETKPTSSNSTPARAWISSIRH
jgi:hypothetical protein